MCFQPDCPTVVSAKDAPFARIEHHKIHEYARASSSKVARPFNVYKLPDAMKRRRGRPPKYPKNEIPAVPKIDMSDEEIAAEIGRHPDGLQNSLLSGFKRYKIREACPDEKCAFFAKDHYHCVRHRCHHATDRADVLNLHAKDFHNYISILPGFEFFDRVVNCRRPHCHNNKANKHFHCMRPRCDYSFVRYSTMAQHDKKHKLADMGHQMASPPVSKPMPVMAPVGITIPTSTQSSPTSPFLASPVDDKDNIIKTRGTYYPLSALPQSTAQAFLAKTGLTPSQAATALGVQVSSQSGVMQAAANAPILIPQQPAMSKPSLVTIAPKPAPAVTSSASVAAPTSTGVMGMPLTMLLQKKANQVMPQLNWLEMKMNMHFGMTQNCGRPFCKLKKRDHYHCYDCNQAFSDPIRLKSHITKHGMKLDKSDNVHSPIMAAVANGNNTLAMAMQNTMGNVGAEMSDESMNENSDFESEEDEEREDDEVDPSSSLNLNPAMFSNLLNQGSALEKSTDEDIMDLSTKPKAASSIDMKDESELESEEPDEMNEEYDRDEMDNEDGKNDVENEPVGNGTKEILEDGESELVIAEEASDSLDSETGVSFSRRGRKRTATKHQDFVDSDSVVVKQRRTSNPRSPIKTQLSLQSKEDAPLEGYKRYHFAEDCNVDRCAYRLTNTHFHCGRLDCNYSFSDRTRAIQHTVKHGRTDKIMGDDFQQFRIHTPCDSTDCEFSRKSSHYHCLRCSYICTDTSKVTVHRKFHNKMDGISAKGFEKITGTVDCGVDGCSQSKKQTHYHCTFAGCKQAVTGPAQMGPHQLKHTTTNTADIQSPATTTTAQASP